MDIHCVAPIRICDLGGWTDTWFAEKGCVLNIAVFPSVEVNMRVRSRVRGETPIAIFAENYNQRYELKCNPRAWTKHPLIEAAFRLFDLPKGIRLDVTIYSDAPAGASTGTSAAVSVALLGAMDLVAGRWAHLVTATRNAGQDAPLTGRRDAYPTREARTVAVSGCAPGRSLTSHEIASKAHFIESELLRIQSGIQDQISSAYGGINFIEITKYPEASVSPVRLTDELAWELESRLVLIYLGKPHSSSAIHETVIRRLEQSPQNRRCLQPLREAALAGKNALMRGDLDWFGQAMIDNTRAQAALHPALVGERARQVVAAACEHGVTGYKVNGAGGDGGSVTLLLKAGGAGKHDLIRQIERIHPEFRHIPIILAPHGLRRWQTADQPSGRARTPLRAA